MQQQLAVLSALLASSIAAEWNVQKIIQPNQMPLMTLACTTLDQTSTQMTLYQQHCIQYLSTDTICYFADPTNDRVL